MTRWNTTRAVWRLAAVILLMTVAVACSNSAEKEEPVKMSRVAGVKATEPAEDFGKWCDIAFPPGLAPKLELPPVEPANTALPANRWVWLNLWATWCKPCLREMPLLKIWKDMLTKENVPFDLWFLSVDEEAGDLYQFLKSHPEAAPGKLARLTKPDALQPWLAKYKVSQDASIPIHIIAAPDGTVRCVRLGSLSDSDTSIVKGLIK